MNESLVYCKSTKFYVTVCCKCDTAKPFGNDTISVSLA